MSIGFEQGQNGFCTRDNFLWNASNSRDLNPVASVGSTIDETTEEDDFLIVLLDSDGCILNSR